MFDWATRLATRFCLAAFGLLLLAGCSHSGHWNDTDISGSVPTLSFSMVRAEDHKAVTGADYRGKVTLLYFGYTFCPDVCPLTLSNVAQVLKRLGPDASRVRLLFVTVDPDRDSLAVLKRYTEAFAPEIDGLRGDADALAALARRYRVAYSVDPHGAGGAYEVTHSSGIYVFDRRGKARLLISSLSTASPDIEGVAADLRRLLR
ncbi:MAG TPA: SCO family protein [Sphingomonadaceae bacterium]|nr:SCO family protein [Sphingomonadaceae bacterium]